MQQRHWSVDEARFKRTNPEQYRIWQLEQRINSGLGDFKLNRAELRRLWPQLHLDQPEKHYLEQLLWPSKRS